MMDGRRWSNGLHQAVEAKEGVKIEPESQTMATITFQNYFRMYPKLSGMTGTAATEAAEFFEIYKMNVVTIPTNVEVLRIDEDDEFYKNTQDKFKAIAKAIAEKNEIGQPVLVGTVSIEKSELLSQFLKDEGVEHAVLNARFHESEARIVAQAGRLGGVTIATNMAGRGTDIQLGGNVEYRTEDELADVPEGKERDKAIAKIKEEVEAERQKVLEAGGLYVIGTERHESRRIDNQLRGRSGRQGDPGASSFYISLEDDLMRIFGSERIDSLLQKMGLKEGEAIFHPWMTRAIEKAQTKVEQRNYEIRKNLLKYDDVMNDQRKVIFEQRLELMDAEHVSDTIAGMREEVLYDMVHRHIPPKAYPHEWDAAGLQKEFFRLFGLQTDVTDWVQEEGIAEDGVLSRFTRLTDELMARKQEKYGDILEIAQKRVLLQTLDGLWKDHLHTLDHLRHGINLRAYGQTRSAE